MTKEEAISALKNTAWIGTDKKVGEVEKAIMMAIEVLKAQNVTDTNVWSNDLISRQEAIQLIECMKPYQQDADDICEMLQNMPSAQPDAIPLEWIAKHLEWLDNCDNDFAQLAKVAIRAMVEIWKKEKT